MALAKSVAESLGSTRFLVYPNVETSGFLQKWPNYSDVPWSSDIIFLLLFRVTIQKVSPFDFKKKQVGFRKVFSESNSSLFRFYMVCYNSFIFLLFVWDTVNTHSYA